MVNIASVLSLLLLLGACSGSTQAPRTRPTSAQLAAAGSPELRTVDNAGFVDPAGRTRQVSAGGGPSPVGRGNGVAPLERERPSGRSESTTPPPQDAVPMAAPADTSELTERAARALCDRESDCGRVGSGKVFESADACLAEKRDRVRRAVDRASCDEVRGDRVAACLTAIRRISCGPPSVAVQPPAECAPQALCGP